MVIFSGFVKFSLMVSLERIHGGMMAGSLLQERVMVLLGESLVPKLVRLEDIFQTAQVLFLLDT